MTNGPVTVDVERGVSIAKAAEMLVEAARSSGGRAVMIFNRLELSAEPTSIADDVVSAYDRAWRLSHGSEPVEDWPDGLEGDIM